VSLKFEESGRFFSTALSPISALDKYRAGYSDCAREVARYLATPEPPPLPSVPTLSDSGSKGRLLRHLDACIAEINIEICPILNTSTLPSQPAIKLEASKFDLFSNPSKSLENLIDRVQANTYIANDPNPIDFSNKNGRTKSSKSNGSHKSSSKAAAAAKEVSATNAHVARPPHQQDENNNRGVNCNNFSSLLAEVISKERKLQQEHQDKVFPMSSAFFQTFAKGKSANRQMMSRTHESGSESTEDDSKELTNGSTSLSTVKSEMGVEKAEEVKVRNSKN
jgi:Hairy Orange